MTTGAMVLGAVPLALATGAGAESRQDIGWVIVGGLLVGTLFTLFVIPVVYTYLSRRVFIEADDELTPDTRAALPARSAKAAQRARARRIEMRGLQKEEPRRGECQGSYALHRTHYRPRPNTTGQLQHAFDLWQFFDGSLSISSIATSICGRAFTPRDASRATRQRP